MTKKTKKPLAAAVAAAWVAISGAVHAQAVVFGDSLSDAGTFGSKFTTNPGPVWSELIVQRLGGNANPAQFWVADGTFTPNPAGGDIWAQGGARIAQSPGVQPVRPTQDARPVATQVQSYLAANGGAANGATTYFLWGGANDIFWQTGYSGNTPTVMQAEIQTAAQQMAGLTAVLRQAGAKRQVVLTVPDIGATPFGLLLSDAARAGLSGLTTLYNLTLNSTVGALGEQGVLLLNADGLFKEVVANPAAFGFTVGNTAVACTTPSSLLCSGATLVAPNAASTYLFADEVHPSTAGHELIADFVAQALSAPYLAGAVADQLALTANAQWRLVSARNLAGATGAPRGLWVTASGERVTTDATATQAKSRGTPVRVDLGFDTEMGEGWWGGLTAGFIRDELKAKGLGDADGNGAAFAAYLGKRWGERYLTLSAGLTGIDYDLRRDVTLRTMHRTERGSTSGNVRHLRLEFGQWLGTPAWQHGPFAALGWRWVHLAGYQEEGGTATSLRYATQDFDQGMGEVGYQLAVRATPTLEWQARVALVKPFQDSRRTIHHGSVGWAGSFPTEVGVDNGAQATADLGVQWQVAPMQQLRFGLYATSGQNDQRAAGLSLSWQRSF
ncbi:autotransporter domain-containing protein [Hydrogenophilus islandicus]